MSPKRMLSAPGCASRLLSQIQRESIGLITEGVVLQNCGCRCRLGALLPSEEPALLLDITDTPRSYTRNLSKSYAVLRLPGLHQLLRSEGSSGRRNEGGGRDDY